VWQKSESCEEDILWGATNHIVEHDPAVSSEMCPLHVDARDRETEQALSRVGDGKVGI